MSTIRTGVGNKFLEELPLGIHTLSETGADTIKMAAYGPNAVLTPNIDAYTTTGEIAGGGYTAGGIAVPLTMVGRLGSSRSGGVQFAFPYLQPTNDTTLSVSGVGIRGIMLYNASQSNRNIFVLDLGATITPYSQLVLSWAVGDVVDEADVLIPLVGGTS